MSQPSRPTVAPGPAAAKEMFARVLRSWAMDALSLRRRGLDRPSFRRGAWGCAGTIAPATRGRAEAA